MNLQTKQALVRDLKANKPKHYLKLLKTHYGGILAEIEEYYKDIPASENFLPAQKVFHWLNQTKEVPKCPVTNVVVNFDLHKFCYKKFAGRGVLSEESIRNRAESRVRNKNTPKGEDRIFRGGSVFDYEPGYEEEARQAITAIFAKAGTAGGTLASIKSAKNAKLYCFLKEKYSDSKTTSEQLYRFLNRVESIPLCPLSGKPRPYVNFVSGYSETHPSASADKRRDNLNKKLKVSPILPKEETIKLLRDLIDSLKNREISVNNLKQSAARQCPALVRSVVEHTKEFKTLTGKWSERAYQLLHQIPEDMGKARFSSFGVGYYDTFVHTNSSAGEEELASWIESLGIGPVSRHERVLDGLEVDVLVRDLGVGIEYHGEYYHNYELRGKDYHKQKADVALVKGMKLLQVFESEWYNKKEIIKSMVKSKLGVTGRRVFARSCRVVHLTAKQKDAFLNENHIQGTDKSSVAFGLEREGELLCCMTFGRGYNKQDNSVELVRFCSVLDTTVVGGANSHLR